MAEAWARSGQLEAMRTADEVDVFVIGAGIVGAGIALDAATRGLRVAIADRADFASGTSSRSTKLLHGGIRYMPQFRFGLVHEGLREQKVLERIAGHLAQPLRFVIPIYQDRGFGDVPRWVRHPRIFEIALRLGLWFYDLLGGRIFGRRRHLRHRVISADEACRRVPGLRRTGLKRAFVYYDGETDDARLTLAALRTAVEHGAVALNWAEVTATEPRPAGGYVVHVEDHLGGERLTVPAQVVVAATGAFRPPEAAAAEVLDVVRSKGAHLVTTKGAVGIADEAVVLPETEDERLMYVVPWQGMAVIGTTDTPYRGDPAHPAADEDDVAYLTRHVHQYLDVPPFEPLSAWGGLRALVDTGDGSTAEASREHKVTVAGPGYVQVAGGKLTGYRRIAADATDRAAAILGARARSRTSRVALAGAGASGGPERLHARLDELALPRALAPVLHQRYGTGAADVLDLAASRPELRERLGDGTLLAEVAHAARHESAATISDVTLRRTRLSWFTPDHGRKDASRIAAVLAAELDWDDAETARQLAAFEKELEAEGL